nr:MAG TPA: major capsid protein [Caudoviricetes sp.]DAS49455.1 MAG TPA: major capsid protein [Caudoviricetes sp.]
MVRAEAVLYVAIESLDSFAVVKEKAAPKPNPPAEN